MKLMDIAKLTDEQRAALVKASKKARPTAQQRREIEHWKQALKARAA